MSPTYIKARMAGAKMQGRSAMLDAGSFAALAALQRGDSVVIPLLGGEQVTGRVNLVQRDAGGILLVGGELTGSRAGSFSLGNSGQGMGGTILLHQEEVAYTLVEQRGGQVVMQEKHLSEVVCFRMPRPKNEQVAAVRSLVAQAVPPVLSSRPGATAVLYLDFDGETVTDPFWNGGNTIVAQPSSLTSAQITEVWNRVKEDYWPFNVDVTTDRSRYDNAPIGRRMRCIITPTDTASPGAGGVARLNSFAQAGQGGVSATIPCWVFNFSVVGVAESISHELGHTFGLRHDGDASKPSGTAEAEYYFGHGTGAVSWAPIMGVGYDAQLVQWSKGEYANANNLEDDLAIIGNGVNGFGLIADEAGDSRGPATPLNVSGGSVNQVGIISGASDADFYVFTVGALSNVSVNASPASISPDLDILLELQDNAGTILVISNPDTALNASVSYLVPAGTYYLKVQGTGRGSVLGDGYSNYGSIGYYSLTGSIVTIVAPTITTQPANQTVSVGQNASLTVTVTGTAPFSYQWRKEETNLSGATNATYSLTSVQTNDAGTYTVVVSNPAGAITSAPPAVLTVFYLPPTITMQPANQTVTAGQNASFTVAATGSAPLAYQWCKDGTDISGATNTIYSLTGVQANYAGSYTVVVSNPGGAVTSAPPAVLTVNPPPSGMVVAWGDNSSGQTNVPPAAMSGVVAISAGEGHVVVLKNDGGAVAWGHNYYGQATVPAAAQNAVTAVAAGFQHSLVLKNDGTLFAWGDTTYGQTTVPSAAQGAAIAIAAGLYHSVALTTNGAVVAWGRNNFGQATVPAGALGGVVAIAAGSYHNVALKADGTVVVWGNNAYSQATVPAAAQSDVVAVAAGSYHLVVLKSSGAVVAWGQNTYGQATVPAAVLSGVVAIAAGGRHSMALKSDGSMVTWGDNSSRQRTLPAAALGDVKAIEAGSAYSVALIGTAPPTVPTITIQPANQLVAMGQNASFTVAATGTAPFAYQWCKDGINLGGATNRTYTLTGAQPNHAGGYTVVVSNTAGAVTSAPPALLTVNSGVVMAWGENSYGETTVPVAAQSGVTAIAAGYFHTVALRTNGSMVAWGHNFFGQATVPAAAQNGVRAIAAGLYHSMSLKSDGSVVAWGYNDEGQTTVPISAQSGVTAIAAGAKHSVALKSDGSIVAWGFNYYGQTTVPAAAQSGVTAITAGDQHTVALKSNGSVVVWGYNGSGQTAVPVSAQSGVLAIAAGAYHTVALKSDGSVVAWGQGTFGQTTVPPLARSGVTAIAAGGEYTLALRTDGSVVAWGHNGFGQTTVPTATLGNAVTAIAAGNTHAVALLGSEALTIPAIATPPVNQTVVAGANVTFNVIATGQPPLTYQWLKDGTNLANATGASLVLTAVTTNQGGLYTVVVSNASGTVTSTPPAVLTLASSLFQPPTAQNAEMIRAQGFGLNLLLETGRAFRVQFKNSVNDATWTDLTNFTSSGMAFQFLDAAATNQARRFYRVVSP